VQGLIDKGKAYVVDGDVYYHIPSFPEYGKLSKQRLEDLAIGARVEENKEKKNPLDFALWKSEPQGEFWQSPWGWGRPGWAIECSAMAAKHLGEQIDIHAGGMDLIFPHHENEIAQSEGLFNKKFSKYWMHNAFVRINQEKMSKSLGNFFTLRDVFKQFDPMVIRFYYLTHHYKAPLDFSFDDIQATQKSYQRLCRVFKEHEALDNPSQVQLRESGMVKEMLEFLLDDLNTPGMFGVLFENLATLQQNPHDACRVKALLQGVLGLTLEPLPEKEVTITSEMHALIEERERARAAKDWKKADQLRDQLAQLGYVAQDKKSNK
jgi:cysteinyl-tRNA synthetase